MKKRGRKSDICLIVTIKYLHLTSVKSKNSEKKKKCTLKTAKIRVYLLFLFVKDVKAKSMFTTAIINFEKLYVLVSQLFTVIYYHCN